MVPNTLDVQLFFDADALIKNCFYFIFKSFVLSECVEESATLYFRLSDIVN